MTFRPLFLISLIGLLAWPPPAYAGGSGTEAASFLDIPVGAGPAALGGAYSARAEDAYAPAWNPAGLGRLDSIEAAGMHAPYLLSSRYEFMSLAVPLFEKNQGFGLSAQLLSSGDIDGRDEAGTPTGTYEATMAAYSLAYGFRINEDLALGATGKLITEKIADASGSAYAADLGLLYHPAEDWRLALVAANLGTQLKLVSEADALPRALRFGADWAPEKTWELSAEGVYRNTGLISISAGGEFKYADQFSLRAGYDTSHTKELGAMAGVRGGFAVFYKGQELSYAVAPFGDLGTSQYVSLVFRFTTKPRRDRPEFEGATSANEVLHESTSYQNMDDMLTDSERKSLWGR